MTHASTIVDPPAALGQPGATVWYQRLGVSAAVVLVLYVLLALCADSGGYLSTDTGGKTATLEAMVSRGDLDPDLGYWAAEFDPDASVYPMWSTQAIDGRFINVTTLPMIYAARPLYQLGGADAIIVLPILGALATALGARALTARLGGGRNESMTAFWVVALASPITIYALDFWEHTIGTALMVWGVVATLDASRSQSLWAPAALAAGLAFGLAASMRQEALIYGFVAAAALGLRLLYERRVLIALSRGIAFGAGTALMVAANAALEAWAVGSASRVDRATGTADAGVSDLGLRLKEAIITGLSPQSAFSSGAVIMGFALLVGGITAARSQDWGKRRVAVAVIALVTAVVLLDLLVNGRHFVPGLIATTPLAAVGLARGWGSVDRRWVTLVALASLPLVWAFQYTGGAGPQWGGRYILTTAILLVAVGCSTVNAPNLRAVLSSVLGVPLVLGVLVSGVGVVWTIERSHAMADIGRTLADRPEDVLVFTNPFLPREFGPVVLDQQWLSAYDDEGWAEVAAVLDATNTDTVGLVARSIDEEEGLPGWRPVGVESYDLLGTALMVQTWVRQG